MFRGTRFARTLIASAVLISPILLSRSASAHEGEEGDLTAETLVRQAIAILRGQPDQLMVVEDKIEDAIVDDEVEGVDLDLLRSAQVELESGRIHEALDLLERSVGATPHRLPGTQDGVVDPILHERSTGGGFAAPSIGGVILLVGAAVLALLGGLIVRRVHP